MRKLRVLNGNTLKIIAAILMVIDHVGSFFCPYNLVIRSIGRLSFPVFAFMIAEGAKYTKNKWKYLLTIFGLGVICQVVYYFFDNHSLHMNILITFSISLVMIYILQFSKKLFFNFSEYKALRYIVSPLIFIGSIIGLWVLCQYVSIEYRFFGIISPVLASLVDFKGINVNDKLKKLDNYYLRVFLFGIGLVFVSFEMLKILGLYTQFYCLLALIILLFYNETRGKRKMKYFFYLFYPIHLVLIYGVFILMKLI